MFTTAGSQSTKKGERTTKGVQTSGYCSPIEFPPPPECALDDAAYQREEEMLLGIVSFPIIRKGSFQIIQLPS